MLNADLQRRAIPASAFAPELGPNEFVWLELVKQISAGGPPANVIASQLKKIFSEPQPHSLFKLKYAFALSVLFDLVSAGADCFVADSVIFVCWPDWTTQQAKSTLRNHLAALRDEGRGRTLSEAAQRGALALHGSMNANVLADVLANGLFELHEGKQKHPSGASYDDIFAAAVASWSMPYRDREGRRLRFVLTVSHGRIGQKVPAGILEACDGPPFHPLRDNLLGVSSASFTRWIKSKPDRVPERLQRRIEAIYKSLRLPKNKKRKLSSMYTEIEALEKGAAGRSNGHRPIMEAKRLTYAARLARAHRSADALRKGKTPEPTDLAAIPRVIRDLMLPRVGIEISICGALPPFSEGLTGKLIASLVADKAIRDVCKRPPGQILQGVFNTEILEQQFPKSGALLVTTQGLYAKHSAQYQGVSVPGRRGATVELEKIGLTAGSTTSLLSRRTFQLATQILSVDRPRGVVSLEYGSGGSKRQRQIEAAVNCLGLPREIVHPVIQRPYYAAVLASNLPEIVLLNDKPDWLIEPRAASRQYVERATELWRQGWLKKAQSRITQRWANDVVPGLEIRDRGMGIDEPTGGRRSD